MRATHEIVQEPDGRWVAKAFLRYGKRFAVEPREVYFRVSEGPLAGNADFLIPVALAPAMVRGESLEIDGQISTKLVTSIPRLQTILGVFAPAFGHHAPPIEVSVDGDEARAYGDDRGVACFFSGGVDSMYTALQHRNELSALVFLQGLDIREDAAAYEKVVVGVRRAAAAIGLPLIEVETNAKIFADRFVNWELYCGAPLAATALLLQSRFRKFYIAGSRSLANLFASGTHPMLDPLWGSESLEIENDAYAERWEKVEYLLDSEEAQQNLRVCFRNHGGAYNCCECVKCVWVMTLLAAFGGLDRFKTFDKPLNLQRLFEIDLSDSRTRIPVEVAAAGLAKKNVNPEILEAIFKSLRRWNPQIGEPAGRLGSWFAEAWPRPRK